MKKYDQHTNAAGTRGFATGDDASAHADAVRALAPPKRTPGLQLFDTLLYPIITNFGVFAISVAATYLTSHGADKNAAGKAMFGKFGEFMHRRGQWVTNKLTKAGMSEGQADMAKMVFFSFADGTLLAPVIKGFEDNRENIGKAFDDMMGTRPANDDAYKAEPKQSWASVLGGRLATVAIVVPTAVALSNKDKITGKSLNDRFFNEPGKKFGEAMKNKPSIAKFFKGFDMPYLGKTVVFEAFYTSVCTAGVYFLSRIFASMGKKPESERYMPPENPPTAMPPAPLPVAEPVVSAQPLTQIQPDQRTIEPSRMAANPALAPQF